MEPFSTKYYGFQTSTLIPQLLHAIRHATIFTNSGITFPNLMTHIAPGIADSDE